MQPSSGRMKQNINKSSNSRQHVGKANLISLLWLSINFIFPICHRCKENDVAQIAGMSTHASWCPLEYIVFMETLAINSGCSPDANYVMGFRHHIPFVFNSFIIQYLWVATPTLI